jgi:hypothetical protein
MTKSKTKRSRQRSNKIKRKKSSFNDGSSIGVESFYRNANKPIPITSYPKPASFHEYMEMHKNGRYDFPKEPEIIDNPNAIVYVIGDLEGDTNILYRWLLYKNFINTDLQWIAPENVYVIQCGDQVDNSLGYGVKNQRGDAYFPFYLRRMSITNYYNLDIYLLLFLDYLSIKSNHHVLSTIGNHEILNTMRNFSYVNLSQFLQEEERQNINALYHEFVVSSGKYQEFLDSKKMNIINFLENRRKLFMKNGMLGKVLCRRNFIIRFNDLLISHAGVTKELMQHFFKTTKHILGKTFNMDVMIQNMNNQINIDTNWARTNPYTEGDFNESFNVIKNGSTPTPEYNHEDTREFTYLFILIINGNNGSSPIWNRIYVPSPEKKLKTKNMDNCIIKSAAQYTVVTGHNKVPNIVYCDCTTTNECQTDFTKISAKPHWIATDVGGHTKPYPYLEAMIKDYNTDSFSVDKFPDESNGLFFDPIFFKDNSEINTKLGIIHDDLSHMFDANVDEIVLDEIEEAEYEEAREWSRALEKNMKMKSPTRSPRRTPWRSPSPRRNTRGSPRKSPIRSPSPRRNKRKSTSDGRRKLKRSRKK